MPPFIASDVLSIYNPDNSSFTDYTDQDLDSYGLSDVLHVLHCSDEDQPEQLPGGDDESVNEDAEGDGSSVAHISTKDSGTSSGRKPGTDNTINAAVDGKATVLIVVRHRTDVVKAFLKSIDPDLNRLINDTQHFPTPPFQDKPGGVIASTLWYLAPAPYEPRSYHPYQAQVRIINLWILPASSTRTSTHRPIVVICPVPGDTPEAVKQMPPEKWTKGNTDIEMLVDYFEENSCERADRIAKNMYYVFVDLHYALGHKFWSANINALKDGHNFTAQRAGERALIALSRVKLLHRRVGEIYRLLDLRMIYVTSIDGYIGVIPQLSEAGNDGYVHGILQASTPITDAHATGQDLKRRLSSISTEIGHYERDMGILLEKFRNLIDLEFNMQSTVTNQNIEAITYLAFLFAPMSFIAAVFGVNGITAPKFFWITAIPVFLAAVSFAYWMRPTVRLLARKESERHGLALETKRRSRRQDDSEA